MDLLPDRRTVAHVSVAPKGRINAAALAETASAASAEVPKPPWATLTDNVLCW